MKQCSKCKETKLITLFSKDKTHRDGLRSACAKCDNLAAAKSRETSRGRAGKLVTDAKTSSKKRKLEINISVDWVEQKLKNGVCELTGLPFDFTPAQHTQLNKYAPSLDRINSKKGYTKDNVRVVLWAVNAALGQYDDEEMLPILEAMVENIKKNVRQKSTTPVSIRPYSKGEEHTKHGIVPTSGTRQDSYDLDHHRGAVCGEDSDHRAQEGSGDSVAHRNRKVEPSPALTRLEDNGDAEPEIVRLYFGGRRLFD